MLGWRGNGRKIKIVPGTVTVIAWITDREMIMLEKPNKAMQEESSKGINNNINNEINNEIKI